MNWVLVFFWNIKPLWNCVNFSHTLLLSRFVPCKSLMPEISLPPTSRHIPAVAINFLRVNWSTMFTVLVFWLSQAFTFFNYGMLIIVTMITHNPRFLQLRGKPYLLLMNTLRCLQQSCYLALPPRLATLIKSPYLITCIKHLRHFAWFGTICTI